MAKVEIYTKSWCGYCKRAKKLLERKKIAYREIPVDDDERAYQTMLKRGISHTVPQIFIDGAPIGGCDELHDLDEEGLLDPMLRS